MPSEYSSSTDTNSSNDTNYYLVIQKYLKKQYPDISKQEANTLSREIVFAPESYTSRVNSTPKPVKALRENLADFIERDKSNKDFIPYSLDAEIADLIEKNNCETSSMNEYYRWISATSDILRHMSDGEITHSDVSERNEFINMSYDREAEILLCLSLYEGAGKAANKAKMDTLKFKLARLREMRSIVRNTSTLVNSKSKEDRTKIQEYYDYCTNLLTQKENYIPNFNLILNLNINHSNDEDLEEDYSYINYLRQAVLEMMRRLEEASEENQRPQQLENVNTYENETEATERNPEVGQLLNNVHEREGR